MTISQIKKKAGDNWALIYNPVYDPKKGKIVAGDLIMCDKNKKKLIDFAAKDKNNTSSTILCFGKVEDDMSLLNFF